MLHVNSYSNAYVRIRVLCAQKLMFTCGVLDEGNREQLFSVMGSQWHTYGVQAGEVKAFPKRAARV